MLKTTTTKNLSTLIGTPVQFSSINVHIRYTQITQIITLCNRGEQKGVLACTKHPALRYYKRPHQGSLLSPKTRIWGDHGHRLNQTGHLKIRAEKSPGVFPVFTCSDSELHHLQVIILQSQCRN